MDASAFCGGWYETLRFRGGSAVRRTVYVVVVPEVGPFVSDDVGRMVPVPLEARDWEWHGPYPTPLYSQLADLQRDPPVADPLAG